MSIKASNYFKVSLLLLIVFTIGMSLLLVLQSKNNLSIVKADESQQVMDEEETSQQVTFNFFTNQNGEINNLSNVSITLNSSVIGTSDINGNATLTLNIGDKLTFELSGYIFSNFTYYDATQHNFKVQGAMLIENKTVQISVKDGNNQIINYVEVYEITDNNTPILKPTRMNGQDFVFESQENEIIRVVNINYAPVEFVVTSDDLVMTRDIILQKFQSLDLKIIAIDNKGQNINLSDVKAYVDGKYYGITNGFGEIIFDKIYKGQIVTFEHSLYKVEDYTFDGITLDKTLVASYKEVKVLIEFHRPQVEGDDSYDPNNSVIPVDEVLGGGLTIYVLGQSIFNPIVYEDKLCFDGMYYANVYFSSGNYAITDEDGKVLIQTEVTDSSHKYGAFIIDPLKAVDNNDGYITFKLFARKYLDLSGKIEFPEGYENPTVSIFVNNAPTAKTTSNDLGEFYIENVLEGDEIIFQCDGLVFKRYFAMDKANNNSIVIKPAIEEPVSYLGLYIFFGVLLLFFIIPFFIRLRPKKKIKYGKSIENTQSNKKDE